MHEWQSLSHVRWECTYHVVIVPKYRKKVFYGRLKQQIGAILRDLCRQRGIELLDEARVRQYIREQDELERRQGELDLNWNHRPQRGLPNVNGPFGGAFLIPRPLDVVDYCYFNCQHLSLAPLRHWYLHKSQVGVI